MAVPSSPVDQQRDQSRNDDEGTDRCGKASAWSGKIEEAGNLLEQARGVGEELSYSFHAQQQTSRSALWMATHAVLVRSHGAVPCCELL